MATINNCPVTLEDFKKHLRNPPDMLDEQLQMALMAAAVDAQNFTLLNFDDDFPEGNVPEPIKEAILLKAAYLIEHPTDSVNNLTTCSSNLLRPYVKWDRMRTK